MDSFGFLKVAAAIPHLRVGDCDYNAERMAALAEEAARRGVELLLNYCLRFYARQFITREEINHSMVKKFISLLDEYIARKAEH